VRTLPQGWAVANLSMVADWGSGGTPSASTKDYYGGNIPWAVIGDLNDGPIACTAASITEAGLSNSSAKMVEPDAVLIAMYGSIGKLGLPTIPMATNQAIAFAIPYVGILERRYLFYFLMKARHDLTAAGKGATQRNISQTILKQWSIPLAPLEEQRRIVAAIDEQFSRMDVGVAATQQVRQNLKHMRAALLQAAVTGRLVSQDFSEGSGSDLLTDIQAVQQSSVKPNRDRRVKESCLKSVAHLAPEDADQSAGDRSYDHCCHSRSTSGEAVRVASGAPASAIVRALAVLGAQGKSVPRFPSWPRRSRTALISGYAAKGNDHEIASGPNGKSILFSIPLDLGPHLWKPKYKKEEEKYYCCK
jgi:Type I restriction modification DNA specificity domain